MRLCIEAKCDGTTDIQPISSFSFTIDGKEILVDADSIIYQITDDGIFFGTYKGLYYLENDEYCHDELHDKTEFLGVNYYDEVDENFDLKDIKIDIRN